MTSWLLGLSLWLIMPWMGLNGYTSRYVATDGGRLHYFTAPGEGRLPPVLLLHGIGSQASDLYPVMQRLRPYVRKVIAVDMPGHGISEVAVEKLPLPLTEASFYQGLDRILAHEEPVLLFGNSFGGWQALRYALCQPQELAGLVLVSPAGAPLDQPEYHRLQQIFAEDSTRHPEALIPLLFNQPPPWQGIAATFIQARFSAPGVQALIARFTPEAHLDADPLRGLTVPALLIWGKQDRIFPVELPFFKQNLPARTKVIEPPDFTHSPYIEAGMEKELAEMMLTWVRGR
ncbi:MAG: alpha/beta fold hydrolase [Candidatus Sericytochromatia bacterium]